MAAFEGFTELAQYLDDETVPKDSRCPTFAACVLAVDSPGAYMQLS